MNELQIFNNPEFGEIRTFMEQDGSVSFCGIGSAEGHRAVLLHKSADFPKLGIVENL